MRISTLREGQQVRSMTETFLGYNHNLRIADGEFYEMQNLTSDCYPVLSPRARRGLCPVIPEGTHHFNGMIAKDALCYVDGTSLYVNGNEIEGFTLEDSPKQLISMGAYIIIFPDKKYINTVDYTDRGDLGAAFSTTSTVTYQMCRIDGTVYTGATVSDTPPTDPENKQLWIDTSSTPHSLKEYVYTSSMWVSIATTYVRISASNIAGAFKQYDGVKISGISESVTDLKDLEGKTSVLYDAHHDEDDPSQDYVVVVGFLDNTITQSTPLTLSREIPQMDFVTESNNRLWGCRYGLNNDGEVVNEIYSCKLGDPKNWFCYMGLSTDSYAASCGTDGQWTGAITHLGYPVFFKEHCLHKVYGQYPANFQIQSTECRGVMKGAGRSLAIVNETLYYKSRSGICAYDGSLPTEISSVLGSDRYSGVDDAVTDVLRCGAVAGAHRGKYYISMKSDSDGKWYLFAYDSRTGLWHKEDELRVDAFCSFDEEMYAIPHTADKIMSVAGTKSPTEDKVKWVAETGVLGIDLPDNKFVTRLLARMSMEVGSRVSFFIRYDSAGGYEHLATMDGTTLNTFNLPMRTQRCDHFSLRIEGEGDAKIYSITQTLEQGSDMR